jgi:FkbM family methyltransferase
LLEDSYETRELRLLEPVLTKTDRVMELGTGIGFLAAFCARAIGNDAVITYEANPKLERHIRNTFRLNRVAPHLVMAAAGVTAGTGTFYLSRDFWASSTIPGGSRKRPVAIPVRSLNIEIARFRPTLIIVDIEGGEVELVPQADLRNVRAVIIELHPRITGADAARTVESALLRAGFTNKAGIDGASMLFQRV